MTSSGAPLKPVARIEGGVDAIVVGASLDGLASAALTAKAGLKTILLGAGGADVDLARREFSEGYFCLDGEHLVTHLDPSLASALDLYRRGLAFANRRLDTIYYFGDGGALLMDGDLYRAREAVASMSAGDAAAFSAFLEAAMDAARGLRPLFDGGSAPALTAPLSSASEHFLTASVDDVIGAAFADPHLKALLSAEASFRAAAPPSAPFGFAALIRRWAGEAAGLQGAAAYAEEAATGVMKALRRAAQTAGVDFRPATGVTGVLVEWDRAAGVVTEDGGQIRAPIVINALPAARAFMDLIGPELLDVEFQSAIAGPPPEIASARVHFALSGAPRDDRTEANLKRRLFYAPDRDDLARAFAAARRGEVASSLTLEAVFASAFDASLAPEKGHVVSAIVHPVPFAAEPDEDLAQAVGEAARETFEKIAPGAGARIVAVDVRLAADEAAAANVSADVFAASPTMLRAWARARKLQQASGIGGYFFCGPEAQIGAGLSGAAARRAAKAAVRYARARAAA